MIRHATTAALMAVIFAFPSIARADQYQYSMTARIRPFLLFWISRNDVGGATLTRRRMADSARYSLLIGTDPERTPRRINRWGYIEEEIRRDEAHLIGVMTQSDEQSLAQADASLRAQAEGRHPFKVIQSTIAGSYATSHVATVAAPADYTFRDVAAALELARRESGLTNPRVVPLPPGTRPGFLAALAEALHARSSTPIQYVYHGRLYELRQTRLEPIASLRIGSALYKSAAAADFIVTSLHDGDQTRFSITYGTSGALNEVPLKMSYQPRWWMQVELTLVEGSPKRTTAARSER